MSADIERLARHLEAERLREAAYAAAVERLNAGEIRQPDAVIALRHAYHRAERHARGFGAAVEIQAPPQRLKEDGLPPRVYRHGQQYRFVPLDQRTGRNGKPISLGSDRAVAITRWAELIGQPHNLKEVRR